MPHPGRLGVCVLTYNSHQRIARCLDHLTAALDPDDRLVVVDNGSSDDTVARVAGRVPPVTVIANGANLGYSAGNNVGARSLAAEGCELLAFVNPDVEVRPTTLHELGRALADDPRAGCAGGVAVSDGRTSHQSFRHEFTLRAALTVYGRARYLPVLKRIMRGAVTRVATEHYIAAQQVTRGSAVAAVSGGCVMFTARAFFDAGGFDERSFLYCEEYMIADRLRALGYRVIAVPEAQYAHDSGSSSGHVPDDFLWSHYRASERLYTRSYLGWRGRAAVLTAVRGAEQAATAALRLLKWRPGGV